MKKLLPLIALLILITSCDSPRSARSVLTTSTYNGQTSAATTSGAPAGVNLNTTTTTTASTTVSNIPSDASHCKFSTDGVNGFASTSSHLGSYTLCQSSTDKNVFYAQFKTPPVGSSGDVSVCFIPHTTSGSNSIYVGNPMCGTFTDPKSVKKITFVKYTTYSSALINNVMFFKDTSYYYASPYNSTQMTLNAYKICMNQLAYGVTTFCEAYKSTGQYVIQSF
ncbi:MAG: hypothetical protein H7336_12470 [Bacteriovorax sp.]|nr:hypothetical protein [Bacteriovorax sp.]